MTAMTLIFTLFVCLVAPLRAQSTPPSIAVGVDPRVELLSIIFRLGGHDEYFRPDAQSPYAEAVDAWFGPFKDDAAVLATKRLRSELSIGYNAPMDFAVHLTKVDDCEERVPFDLPPPMLDRRWTAEAARSFRVQVRDFAKRSRFKDFFAGQSERYHEVEARFRDAIAKQVRSAWLDDFFGSRPRATFKVIPGLLVGGHNYGSSVRFADGRQEFTPVIGMWNWDASGLPRLDEHFLPTVIHEFVHAFTNPLVDEHWECLAPTAEVLFEMVRQPMEKQAYGSPRIMMYESYVRACVLRYLETHKGREAAEMQAMDDMQRGFFWLPALSRELGRYEADRHRYPTLDAFFHETVGFFREGIRPPVVLTTKPDPNDQAVDPKLDEIIVTFDRPMQPGSFSVVIGKAAFPDGRGKPSFDETRRIFRMPVQLEAGENYELHFNGPRHRGFRSDFGIPLESVSLEFRTQSRE